MVVALMLLSAAHARAGQVAGRVLRGATAQVATIEVTNASAENPIEPSVRLVEGNRWVRNVRIEPDGTGPLRPGARRRFTVRFDVAPDAPPGTKESLRFEVTAPGERFDVPSPSVTLDVTSPPTLEVATIRSAHGLAALAPVATLGGVFSGDADLTKLNATSADLIRPGTQVGWGFASALNLPPLIELGKDFTVSMCSTAGVVNRGGSAPDPQPLEHFTGVRTLTGNAAYSIQQVGIPATAGNTAKVGQRAELVFRYDAANSQPPDKYAYEADVRASGRGVSAFVRANEAKGLVWVLTPQVRPGALGTGDVTAPMPAELVLTFANGLVYGPGTGSLLSRNEPREWQVVYREVPQGSLAAPASGRFTPLPGLSNGCPDFQLDGRILTGVLPPPPAASSLVTVTDVRRQPGADARNALEALGLRVSARVGAAAGLDQTEYTVVSQEPAAGAQVTRGAEVVLVLAGPRPVPPAPAVSQITVPNLKGLTGEQARAALESRGLRWRPQIGRAPGPGETPLTVLEQSPPAGQTIASGGEVGFVLLGGAAVLPPASAPPLPSPAPVVASPAAAGLLPAGPTDPAVRQRHVGPVRIACPASPALGAPRYLPRGAGSRASAAVPMVFIPPAELVSGGIPVPHFPWTASILTVPSGDPHDGTWCFGGFCSVGCAYGPDGGQDGSGRPRTDVRVWAAWWASEPNTGLARACSSREFRATAFEITGSGAAGKPAVAALVGTPLSMDPAAPAMRAETDRLRKVLYDAVSPNAPACPAP